MAKASQVVLSENEFYLIKAPNGKVLEVKNFNTENGAAIRLWDYAGHPWQQWKFVDAGEGRWRIQNRFTGKMMDLALGGVVEGVWASEAGIRKGDVILDIDGVKINDNATLSEQIGRRRPNDKVKLSVKRDGKVKQIDVTLRNKAGKTELITKEDVDMVEVLGGKFADAGAKLCRELDIKGGVQVVGIKADGILARARVKQGFVITHINDRPVYSLSDMERMTDKVRSIDGIYPNGRAASYVLVE